MKDRIFLDTNILVYGYIEQSKDKHEIVKKIFSSNIGRSIHVSVQVINEFYSALNKNKIEHKNIKENIYEIYGLLNINPINFIDIELCFKVKEKYKYTYWDSLIIASALQNNCTILYTEDLQHNQIIENKLKIKNPFLT